MSGEEAAPTKKKRKGTKRRKEREEKKGRKEREERRNREEKEEKDIIRYNEKEREEAGGRA